MAELIWLDEYSGQTVDELLSMEAEYRIDSLVLAFEQAVDQKKDRDGDGALSAQERVILAIEALESIGCPKTSRITQNAIDALHLPTLTAEAIRAAMESVECEEALNECDGQYYAAGEDIAGQLFAFIKKNKGAIAL